MRRAIILLTFLVVAFVVTTVLAAPAAQGIPEISVFETTTSHVNRETLWARTARVDVRWEVLNRPQTANLLFEQVFPDGSSVNIELPRSDFYVPSTGSGIVAPVSWAADLATVNIRLRLVNLINNEVLSEAHLEIPVSVGGETGTNTDRPAIARFTHDGQPVYSNLLQNGTQRVNVAWDVVNRPANSNLVFEQMLPDGRAVVIELPRDNPYVISNGSGRVAPIAAGVSNNTITLRVRLYDGRTGRVYDQAFQTLSVLPPGTTPTSLPPTPMPTASATYTPTTAPTAAPTTPAGTITPPRLFYLFVDVGTTVDVSQIAAGNQLVYLSWQVSDRPDGSNLVFEQVLPDGNLVNVELPRTDPLVPSTGNGVVKPLLPTTTQTELIIRVSLRMIATNQTIDYRELVVPVAPPTATPQPSATPTPRTFFLFTDANTRVSTAEIAAGTSRVYLSWQVTDRPQGTNLVFEQVMPDGSLRNIELPRTDPFVPNVGSGVVAPVSPTTRPDQLVIRVSLVAIGAGTVIDSRDLVVPVVNDVSVPTTAPTAEQVTLPVQPTQETLPPVEPEATAEVITDSGGGESQTSEPSGIEVSTTDCAPTFAGILCAGGDAITVAVTVQQFEQGWMILRGDTGQLLVLLNTGSVGTVGAPSDMPMGEPPSGLLLPAPPFEAAWRGHIFGADSALYRDLLGYAVALDGTYSMTIQPLAPAENGYLITLPTGAVAQITPAGGLSLWQVVG